MTQLFAKPILFSGPMVRAILDGRKTQTRRVITKKVAYDAIEVFGADFLALPGNKDLLPIQVTMGDYLWVREAWYAARGVDHLPPRDMDPTSKICPVVDWNYADFGLAGRYRQSMHMPRWASRLTLKVTDVRVERLQEISYEDAEAEGIDRTEDTFGNGPTYCDYFMGEDSDPAEWFSDPVNSFKSLWNGLNAKRGYGWDANPWVAAYIFEVIHQNVNEVAE